VGLILCGSKGQQVVELLLSGPGNRVKVAQYLLLDSEDALKQHLAPISAAYEQLQGDPAGHADPNAESGLGWAGGTGGWGSIMIPRSKQYSRAASPPRDMPLSNAQPAS